ncbi:hypothetical protein G9A89_007136 [Geosiphon pyriformis]|nr:hypothetical protein G9A89_007136 [Geosiphon pyriformis]
MLFPYWITKIVYCFGISQDPITQNYILVTDFASDGNLFDYLQQEKSKISWSQKLTILGQVASALVDIHRKDLVHTDLHTGNILVGMSLSGAQVSIGDLGSCRPITSTSNSHDVYGVLPYVAPEVLKEISCSSASDIYSFGIIMWEVSAGQKPFADRSHDYDLALEICNGLRPEVVAGTPRRYFSLMERCWDAEPAKRPSAAELVSTLLGSKDANGFGASRDIDDQKWLDMLQKAKDAVIKYHPGAVYTSRLLDCPITRTHNVKKDK